MLSSNSFQPVQPIWRHCDYDPRLALGEEGGIEPASYV